MFFKYKRSLAGVLLPHPNALRYLPSVPAPYMPIYQVKGEEQRLFPAVVVSTNFDDFRANRDELQSRANDPSEKSNLTPMITYSVPNDGMFNELYRRNFEFFRFADSFGCRRNSANKVARVSIAESDDVSENILNFGGSLGNVKKHVTYNLPSTSKSYNTYFGGRLSSKDAPKCFKIEDKQFWDVENSIVEPMERMECDDEVAYCHLEPYPIADVPAFVYLEPLLETHGKKKKKKKRKLSQSEHQKVMRIMIGYTLGFFIVAIATFYVVYFF